MREKRSYDHQPSSLPDDLQPLAESTTLKVSVDDYVATVTLARPDKRNAFNDEVIAELNQAFTQLGSSEQVRAIVLAAEGKAFCAGADLNWMRGHG